MICVSLGVQDIAELLGLLKRYPFAEIRLDALSETPDIEGITKLFSGPGKRIATFRPIRGTQEERTETLVCAIEAGASYVDVEMDFPEASLRTVSVAVKRHDCQLIVSHHDMEKTPSSKELERLRDSCASRGADLVKIACKVNRREDNDRLMALVDFPAPVIAIGMGTLGRITRLAGPLIGSPFTYASLGKGLETASGQFDAETLAFLLAKFEKERRI